MQVGVRRLRRTAILLWNFALLFAVQVQALILVGTNEPPANPGWPKGTTEYVALKSLVQWYEGPPFGGGQWNFQSRGDTAALQEAVDRFSRIQGPAPEIVLKSGPLTNLFGNGTFDWEVTVWVQDNWNRLFGKDASPKLKELMKPHPDSDRKEPPLRLTVHLHPAGPDWKAIRLPSALKVNDQRAAGSPKPGPAQVEIACPAEPPAAPRRD